MTFPDMLPFEVASLETNSRQKLACILLERITNNTNDLDPDAALEIIEKAITCFEVTTSAIEEGFIPSFQESIRIGGYSLAIYHPGYQVDDV